MIGPGKMWLRSLISEGNGTLLILLLSSFAFTTTHAIDCSAKLVATVSNQTEDCNGFETAAPHLWPVWVDADSCHGWRATDPDGRLHDNSANNMRCSDDGTKLLYTQFADTLDCQNAKNEGGTEKHFELNVCEEGTPSILKDMATNMDCCLDPMGESCMMSYTGLPDVPEDELRGDISIWLNGEQCDEDTSNNVESRSKSDKKKRSKSKAKKNKKEARSKGSKLFE